MRINFAIQFSLLEALFHANCTVGFGDLTDRISAKVGEIIFIITAAVLIKKECNIESGSGVPNKTKVATISKASVQKIAEMKMRDLNASTLESAMSMIAGTARSMGVVVEE